MSVATLSTYNDDALAASIMQGEAQALSVLYDRHSPVVYATCLRVLNDQATADEVLVDVFHEFWRRADRFDASRGNVLTYLLTMARSRSIDRRRAAGKHDGNISLDHDHLPNDAVKSRDGLSSAVASETTRRVNQAMNEIDPDQRQAIELAFYDGLSHSEIARQLGRPLGTIKTFIRQGLLRLRQCLRMEDEELPAAVPREASSGANRGD